MPGLSTSIHEEGVLIRPRIVGSDGALLRDSIADILSQTRTPDERLGDLSAQVAANNVGMKRLAEAAVIHGWDTLIQTFRELRQYSGRMIKHAMSEFSGQESAFIDYLDGDGAGSWNIPISVKVVIDESGARVDFKGTSDQVVGNVNCPLASTLSSVYYVFIALFGKDVPVNEGCWSVIDVNVPEGSLLNPKYPAAVSAGNVETSQRIVDTTLGALSRIVPDIVPAASQGTMNNLTMGGIDPQSDSMFSFYETIGGGAGATRGRDGTGGIHTHMTNTLNTPIESLETEYPLLVREYSIRKGTGGKGQWQGGDGIIREIEILAETCTISIQSERRTLQPWGLEEGGNGVSGKNSLLFEGKVHTLEAKTTALVPKGAIGRIETPGGGGYGPPPTSK